MMKRSKRKCGCGNKKLIGRTNNLKTIRTNDILGLATFALVTPIAVQSLRNI